MMQGGSRWEKQQYHPLEEEDTTEELEEEEEEEEEEDEEVNHNHNHNHNHSVGIGGYVKVMTDDQLETLRKQISVYATICEQLVQMHKTLTSSHPDLPGVRLANLYCDPLMSSVGHKITARQRWTPTAVQLQILERIFEQGNGTPTKQKIKDITSELSQHGQISETNVYNWFQNRRARSKRKQQNNAVESELDSPKAKAFPAQDICFPTPQPDILFDSHSRQMPFYHGNEQMSGKMEVSGGYSVYDTDTPQQHYNMNING